jgi:hypothetical protein
MTHPPQGPAPGPPLGGGLRPGPGAPPPSPRHGLSSLAIVSIVATAILLVLGVAAFLFWGDDIMPGAQPSLSPAPTQPQQPEATPPSTQGPGGSPSAASPYPQGTCVFLTGTADDPQLESTDCATDGSGGVAYYIVGSHQGTADCGTSMTQYTEHLGESTTVTVCLAEVLVEGSCYAYTDALAAVRRVDCPAGDFRVSQLIETAGAACASGEEQFSYDEWGRTYCLAPVA